MFVKFAFVGDMFSSLTSIWFSVELETTISFKLELSWFTNFSCFIVIDFCSPSKLSVSSLYGIVKTYSSSFPLLIASTASSSVE